METLSGIIEVRRLNVGSRSEGRYPFLCVGEDTIRLRRKGGGVIGDPFLCTFEGKRVSVEGEASDSGFFCVSALFLEDGTPQPFPPVIIPPMPEVDLSALGVIPAEIPARKPPTQNKKSQRRFFPKKGKKRKASR